MEINDKIIVISVSIGVLAIVSTIYTIPHFTSDDIAMNMHWILPVYAQDNTDNRNSEDLCNKLFEVCESPPSSQNTQDPSSDSDGEAKESISEKYFNQGESQVPLDRAIDENLDDIDAGSLLNGTQGDIGFQTFENTTLGVRMLYPADWELRHGNDTNYLESVFISPNDSPSDSYVEKVTVRVFEHSSPITLDQYTNVTLENIQKLAFFNIVETGPTTLSENPAYRVIGVRPGNHTINVIDEWTVKDARIYRITYSLEEAKSNLYSPIALAMHESFVITNG